MTDSPSPRTPDPLQIGGVALDRRAASEAAEFYFSGTSGTDSYAYPAYDAFDGGAGPWRISDGDLLAPVLLNVRTSITAYYSLLKIKPRLEEWLESVPIDARLTEAADTELEQLAELFTLLDEGIPGVRGATFAKVMHRKRPSFVPLYDRYIWWTYVGAAGAPVQRDPGRSWAVFVQLLAKALRADLHRERDWIDAIAATATATSVTPLRALDVVAWRAGRIVSESASADDTDDTDDGIE